MFSSDSPFIIKLCDNWQENQGHSICEMVTKLESISIFSPPSSNTYITCTLTVHKLTKSGHLNGRVEITTPEILRKWELAGCTNSLLSSIMELFRLGPMVDSHTTFSLQMFNL